MKRRQKKKMKPAEVVGEGLVEDGVQWEESSSSSMTPLSLDQWLSLEQIPQNPCTGGEESGTAPVKRRPTRTAGCSQKAGCLSLDVPFWDFL